MLYANAVFYMSICRSWYPKGTNPQWILKDGWLYNFDKLGFLHQQISKYVQKSISFRISFKTFKISVLK